MVWSATAGARSLDQLASGLGHRLSTDSGRLHCHDLDHHDGVSDVKTGYPLFFVILQSRVRDFRSVLVVFTDQHTESSS